MVQDGAEANANVHNSPVCRDGTRYTAARVPEQPCGAHLGHFYYSCACRTPSSLAPLGLFVLRLGRKPLELLLRVDDEAEGRGRELLAAHGADGLCLEHLPDN